MKAVVKCLMAAIVLSLLMPMALMAGDFGPIYEGVEFATRTKTSPRLMVAYALRIDLRNPSVSFFATPSNGGSPYETNMQTTPNFRSAYGLEAAVNANYSVLHSPYAAVDGLLISNGSYVSYDQLYRQAQVLITADKIASIVGTGGNPGGIHTAVAGDAHHLVNGTPLGDNSWTAPRTSLGITADGRFLIWCVVDGRQPGYSDGATILDMSYWMLDFGAYNAINVDGGGSSCLCSAAGGVYNRPSDGAPRSIGANLGVNTTGHVSRIDVFARGGDNNIYQRYWTDTTDWSPSFYNMGAPPGGATSDPSAVAWGPGCIDLFVRGTDGAVYNKGFYAGWSGWSSLGGYIVGSPDACSWNVGRLDVFARSASNTLLHIAFDGNAWSGWEDLGGTITSDPTATSWGPGRIDIFARGASGELLHKCFDWGVGWYGWENLGYHNLVGGPDACAWDKNRLDIFWRTTDNSIRHMWWEPGWMGPENLGPAIVADPGCVSREPGMVDVFGTGTDGQLYNQWFAGGWSGWYGLGGYIVGGPDACSWSNDAGLHQ